MTRKALVIDDEPDLRNLLSISLGRMGIQCVEAGSVGEARKLLDVDRFDICLSDMRLPDGNGIELVRHIQKRFPELPVAMITAYGNVDTAVEALKAGAFDFIAKPVNLDQLRQVVDAAILTASRNEGDRPASGSMDNELIGESPALRRLQEMIAKVARSQSPVYVHGDTGTGKELVARLIHRSSGRRDGPWVPVNCGAIPSELMESEFFGHKKGSFTGAHQDKQGLFEAASGGTLFLDEVAELPMPMQVKLLRAIQERRTKPVGGTTEKSVDVRIVSATHTDLAELVRQGRFRNDLFYRLNVIEIHVPSLRERADDIPLLARRFLERLNRQNGSRLRFSEESIDRLTRYDYPGNIRELENIVERAFTLCEGDTIRADDIVAAPPLPDDGDSDSYQPGIDLPLDDHLAQIERQALEDAIRRTGGNKTEAASLLGMTFRSLRYKLKKYGL